MTRADNFEFTAAPPRDPHLVLDGSIVGKPALLARIAEALAFPDYFGANWDALIDCLSDFSWRNDEEIVIYHAALPQLTFDELGLYLSSLADAAERMTSDRRPRLRLVFRLEDKIAVQKALTAMIAQ